MTRTQGPKRLLAMVVRLLPAAQRDWGDAMSAELDGVVSRRDRWAFAIGCVAAVVRRFAVLKSLTYTVITVAAVAGVVVWSAGIAYPSLRWRVVAVAVALAGVITLGRVPGLLGPVAQNRTARLVRGAGFVVVSAAMAGFLAHLFTQENFLEESGFVVPVIGSAMVCYLLGLVAVTSGRSIATGRALRWGAASGLAAALMWLVAVVLVGYIPFGTSLALAMLTMAISFAVNANAHRAVQAWIAALVGGTVGTLLIVIELVLMAGYAPARMIPDLAPAALTAAADLEQSRAELEDPFVALFLLGALAALALAIVTASGLARTRRAGVASRVTRTRAI